MSVNTAETITSVTRWHDWGGLGPDVHFAHANGFPPTTYRALIEVLCERYHVQSMQARPLWGEAPPPDLGDWSPFVHDLREALSERGLRGIIGIGHSLGAIASLLAAAEDPGLFSAVVAIDPLTLTGLHSVMWGSMKRLGLGDRLPLVRGALRRRDRWPDRRTIRETYRQRTAFQDWQPAVLEDYLNCGFVAGNNGELELRYPRAWEAAIFRAAPHNVWPELRRIEAPVLFIQGAHSDTFTDAARLRVLREMADARVAVVPEAGHFVPMERPAEVVRIMMRFLDSL